MRPCARAGALALGLVVLSLTGASAEEAAPAAPAPSAPPAAEDVPGDVPGEAMPTEEFTWNPGTATGRRGRLGVRAGVIVPGADFDAGPTAGVFWQKELGALTLEIDLAFAQLASRDASSSSSLLIGGAGVQWNFVRGERHHAYFLATLGAISENARSATETNSAMLSSVDVGLGLLTGRCFDIRAGVSLFTNSENVSSASFAMVGVVY
jgi:hypothetical protein